MSYFGAAQSALFYFLACTPCLKVQNHHRSRQQAKKERAVKERIVMEQPHLYRHPEPYNTNPYWSEEIRMGPSLPRKGKGLDRSSKSLSQRRLTAASRDGRPSIGTGSSVAITMSEMGSIASPRPSTSPASPPGLGSAPTVVVEEPTSPTLTKTASVSTGDWNFKRYQREDEELWGHEPSWTGHKLMDAIKQAGSSAGRYVESKLGFEKPVTEEDRYNFYFTPRNPPVNEYHPPVVSSKPAHKDALRWMLQPPPPAKVMDGRVPVSRSSSMMSVGSRRTVSTYDGGSLGRTVGEKALEARLRRGENPFEGELRSAASPARRRSRVARASSVARTKSRRTARTNSFTESEDSSDEKFSSRRRPSHRSVVDPETGSESDDEDEYISKSLEASSNSSLPTHAAQKPRLPTIMSSSSHEKEISVKTVKSGSMSPLQQITNVQPGPDLASLKVQPVLSPIHTNMAIRA
ncbi:hypothetical protein MMYC01_202847 [Madurella mycetomatis]|uniref:Signal peptide-containing protein n=1 Tax=Madurella mycetomatis TaxID=100816 RepID=A0A175W9C1_9PEZI|nr:hypothetical protein MMYC01_202847 [Madurella mycetomatis]